MLRQRQSNNDFKLTRLRALEVWPSTGQQLQSPSLNQR